MGVGGGFEMGGKGGDAGVGVGIYSYKYLISKRMF